jgi:hypothetical protein
MNQIAPSGSPGCVDLHMAVHRGAYSFGDDLGDARATFEAHLLECDTCWRAVVRLTDVVRLIRSDETSARAVASELPGLIGISGASMRPLAGHTVYVIAAAAGVGLLYAIAAIAELGYGMERFGALARATAAGAFVWMTLASGAAFWLISRGARRPDGRLSTAVGLVSGAAALLMAVLWFVLPSGSLVEAAFQTYTVRAAYLKSILYNLALTVGLHLIPFHFVVRMQHQLAAGRARLVLNVLNGSDEALPPRATPFLRFQPLAVLFGIAAAAGVLGMNYLFNNLRAGGFHDLFVTAVLTRTALWIVMGSLALAWYDHSLRELKRESLAVSRLQRGGGISTSEVRG